MNTSYVKLCGSCGSTLVPIKFERNVCSAIRSILRAVSDGIAATRQPSHALCTHLSLDSGSRRWLDERMNIFERQVAGRRYRIASQSLCDEARHLTSATP